MDGWGAFARDVAAIYVAVCLWSLTVYAYCGLLDWRNARQFEREMQGKRERSKTKR